MNVNLQVVELEQYIYGMMDVGRGVTKDRRTIYIYILYIYLSHSHSSYPFMWGSLRLTPNIHINCFLYLVYSGLTQARPELNL